MSHQGDPGNGRVEPRFHSLDDPGGFHPDATPEEGRSRLRGRVVGAFVALAAVGGFAGIAWYATVQGQKDSSAVVPVIRADNSAVKMLPEKPGGMDVPNQDKLVFMQIQPGEKPPKVERLMPPPEKPKARPAPPKAAETSAPSTLPPVTGGDIARAESTLPPPKVTAPPATKKSKPVETPIKAPAKPITVANPAAKKTAKLPPPPVPATQPLTPPKIEKAQAAEQNTVAALPIPSPTGGFRVQLGAVKDKARAAKEAKRLTRLHKSVLGTLSITPLRADLGKRGVFYRLRAGPLPDRAAANALCAKLKARKQGCLVVKP